MGRLNITVVDATGNKEQQATVPDDAPIRRVIAKLVELMNLPVNGPDGQPLNYKFHHKASGRQLDGEQTLKDAGVQEGDVLRLYPEITAGARPEVAGGARPGPAGGARPEPAGGARPGRISLG